MRAQWPILAPTQPLGQPSSCRATPRRAQTIPGPGGHTYRLGSLVMRSYFVHVSPCLIFHTPSDSDATKTPLLYPAASFRRQLTVMLLAACLKTHKSRKVYARKLLIFRHPHVGFSLHPPLGASALCRQALRSLGLRGLGPREKRAIMRRTRQSDTARGGTPWEEGGTMDAHHGISRRHVLGLAMAV